MPFGLMEDPFPKGTYVSQNTTVIPAHAGIQWRVGASFLDSGIRRYDENRAVCLKDVPLRLSFRRRKGIPAGNA